MARQKTVHTCKQCGYQTPKWLGHCPDCRAWNTFEERAAPSKRGALPAAATVRPTPITAIASSGDGEVRVRTGLGELDSVLGGGLVSGSLVLLGGDPGVGKSTLLLMALGRFASRGVPVLYASGEESVRQVQLRGQRLGLTGDALHVLSTTSLEQVEAGVQSVQPQVLVIDSVQTVRVGEIDSIPGSVSQVREVAHRAMVLAKSKGIAVFLVGHVTKSGELAGPKVLEHFVDTVLYFEGDGRAPLRVLRAVKTRCGPAGELGLCEMADSGLVEVPDASARLLQERSPGAPGTAVVAAMEGSRPILAEVQALVGPPLPQTPARTCVGVDRTRVLMLTAVLGKLGMELHQRDLFVNAAGGVRLLETAADLGVVAALASSLTDTPVRDDTVLFGEIGLVGEVRGVSYPAQRLREAARHGFRRAIVPPSAAEHAPDNLEVIPATSVREVLAGLF